MSTVHSALTTWEEFLQLPDAEDAIHYELHDGEVVAVPPPKPIHVYIQSLLVQWLTMAAEGQGRAAQEFPYRPAINLQFWYADVAYLPNEDWEALRRPEYSVYAPPLVIEVLSPSNRPAKIQRQRLAAFSGGTREFWVVDPVGQTIEVSLPGSASVIYTVEDLVPVTVLPGAAFPVRKLFQS
jgi:Uma2 family endonuclease